MKTLKESILANQESVLDDIDNFEKAFKKAEKDYNKLIKKTKHTSTGKWGIVSIKSSDLAKVLAGNTEVYKYVISPKYNQPVDEVQIYYSLDDIYDNNKPIYKLKVNVQSKTITGTHPATILQSDIPYTDIDPGIYLDLDKAVQNKTIIETIAKLFTNKYKTFGAFVTAFNININYTMKI